jgi:hypothetical protein
VGICLGTWALIAGILAIFLAIFNQRKSGLKIAGLVLGIIGVLIYLVLVAIALSGKAWWNENKEAIVATIEEKAKESMMYEEPDYNESASNKGSISDKNAKVDFYTYLNELTGTWTGYEGGWEFDILYAVNYLDKDKNDYVIGTYDVKSLSEGAKMLNADENNIYNAPGANNYNYFTVIIHPVKFYYKGENQDLSTISSEAVYIWQLPKEKTDPLKAEVLAGSSGMTRSYVKDSSSNSDKLREIKVNLFKSN